jgi:hypothetical protein
MSSGPPSASARHASRSPLPRPAAAARSSANTTVQEPGWPGSRRRRSWASFAQAAGLVSATGSSTAKRSYPPPPPPGLGAPKPFLAAARLPGAPPEDRSGFSCGASASAACWTCVGGARGTGCARARVPLEGGGRARGGFPSNGMLRHGPHALSHPPRPPGWQGSPHTARAAAAAAAVAAATRQQRCCAAPPRPAKPVATQPQARSRQDTFSQSQCDQREAGGGPPERGCRVPSRRRQATLASFGERLSLVRSLTSDKLR